MTIAGEAKLHSARCEKALICLIFAFLTSEALMRILGNTSMTNNLCLPISMSAATKVLQCDAVFSDRKYSTAV